MKEYKGGYDSDYDPFVPPAQSVTFLYKKRKSSKKGLYKCCRIGQSERCMSQGFCSWVKVFEGEKACWIEIRRIESESFNFNPSNKRRKIYNQTDGNCYLCGHPVDYKKFTIDHIIPVSRGGSNAIENLLPAHLHCNSEKGNLLLKDFRPDLSEKYKGKYKWDKKIE